ncbi:MAG: hypothetical protein Tsb0019_24470 [Roseibium sp.]
MFIELIATIVAGIAAAGAVMLVNHLTGRRLPRWLAPVFAGLAMLLMTISNEYGWYGRTKEALPEGLVVARTVDSRAVYRPWTYVVPYVERFAAVDTLSLKTHPAQPGVILAETYFFGRWSPVERLPVLVDCTNGKRAALTDAFAFENNGTVSGADWVAVPAGDPLLATICGAR